MVIEIINLSLEEKANIASEQIIHEFLNIIEKYRDPEMSHKRADNLHMFFEGTACIGILDSILGADKLILLANLRKTTPRGVKIYNISQWINEVKIFLRNHSRNGEKYPNFTMGDYVFCLSYFKDIKNKYREEAINSREFSEFKLKKN